jgi:glycosyltransferase involved in cell wall biosynthesis
LHVARPDVLLLSLGTTLGWRRADHLLLEQLEQAGAYAAAVSVGLGASGRLRRGYPVNDVVEMYAARRAVRTAVERREPRGLIISSTTAAMLLPSLPVPYAVRFDAPARLNRPGVRCAFLHSLERRAMRGARITIPLSVAGAEALPEGAARPVVVSPPIDPSAPNAREPEERARLALAYVPDPKAKGLEVVVGGWAAAALEGARLEVYGLEPEWAREHLRRTGVAEPDSLELRGTVPAAEFRARLRRARVFVHGARWEDWGQAPLEALADGALLATVPAGGPYEGLRLARQLDGALVADSITADALARSIRAAFELPDERVMAYRKRAAELTLPYRSEAVQETVARELLPALLD